MQQELLIKLSLLQEQISTTLYSFITNNTIGFLILVLSIYSLVVRSFHSSLIGSWFVNFIGVFFHEFAHAIVGLILGAKPQKFIIFPERHVLENGKSCYVLGSVEFSNLNWFNTTATAMAPLLLLFVAYWIENNFWHYFQTNSLINIVLYIYLLIVFIINSIPSSVDFKMALKNPLGATFFIFIVVLLVNNYNILIDFVYNLL